MLLLAAATTVSLLAAAAPPARPAYVASEAYPVFWHVIGSNASDFSAGSAADVKQWGMIGLNRSFCQGPWGMPELPFEGKLWGQNVSAPFNGGVPQAADIAVILKETMAGIEAHIPDPDWDGLGMFDFEAWTPIWENNDTPASINWHSQRYHNYSIALVKAKHPSWSAQQLEAQVRHTPSTLSFCHSMRCRHAVHATVVHGCVRLIIRTPVHRMVAG